MIAREASAHHACANGGEAGLKLRGDADVVAIDVVGDDVLLDRRRVEFGSELGLDGLKHGLGGPAVAHEEILDARAGAVLAQLGLLLEDAQDGFDDGVGLVLRDEGGDAHTDVRLGGEAAANAKGVADLFQAIDFAADGGERDAVDFGV